MTSVQGAKSFLCLLINSLGVAGFQLLRGPFGPLPLTLEAPSPWEVSLTAGLGPTRGSCGPPLSLLAQSFLSSVMAQLLLEARLYRDPPPHPKTTGKHCLVSSDACLVSQASDPWGSGAKWLWVWGDYPDPFLGPQKAITVGSGAGMVRFLNASSLKWGSCLCRDPIPQGTCPAGDLVTQAARTVFLCVHRFCSWTVSLPKIQRKT